MRDNNVLVRHIKPAGRRLVLDWVNWQVLRRSCATWGRAKIEIVNPDQDAARRIEAAAAPDSSCTWIPKRIEDWIETV